MKNILFTPPADEKILAGEKTLTARFWCTHYGESFKAGDHVTLSTGRKKEKRFAIANILRVVKWDGHYTQDSQDVIESLGMTRNEVGVAEGFKNWGGFYQAYYYLNEHHLENPCEVERRSHFFIEFEVVKKYD